MGLLLGAYWGGAYFGWSTFWILLKNSAGEENFPREGPKTGLKRYDFEQ